MSSRKFLIQFESDDRTKWLYHDEDVCRTLQCVADSVATCHTSGPRPRVTVTVEKECAQPVPIHAL